jgi:hypothetical protein
MWRARFGRGFGPVVRQTAKLMNEMKRTWLSQALTVQCSENDVKICFYDASRGNWYRLMCIALAEGVAGGKGGQMALQFFFYQITDNSFCFWLRS